MKHIESPFVFAALLSLLFSCSGTSQESSSQVQSSESVSSSSGDKDRVKGIELAEDAITLKVGDTYVLNYVITPRNADDRNVTWHSDDSSVVSVSTYGSLYALKAGTARVSVTTEDGGFTDTCVVTVTEEKSSVAVTGIELTTRALSLDVGKTYLLLHTISPSNADNQGVTWKSDDPSVASVTSYGLVTALKAGTPASA